MSDDDKEPIHIEVANITRLTKTKRPTWLCDVQMIISGIPIGLCGIRVIARNGELECCAPLYKGEDGKQRHVLALSPDLADAIGALVLEATAECASAETVH